MRKEGWVAVDLDGLADVVSRNGKRFTITEPVQNAWDEDVTEVHVQMDAVPGKARATLEVTDDSPEGFRDLVDAFTLFKRSYKVDHPDKRGRFNVGEKLLLAIAVEAQISSTKGSVIFHEGGDRSLSRARTNKGTLLKATLRMTREELTDALAFAQMLIPPVPTFVNGDRILDREVMAETEVTLPTELADDEGRLRPTRRRTTVRIYQPQPFEQPHLYELGIPVVPIDAPWHVWVGQKVPLNMERDNVTPAYLRKVLAPALELMAQDMDEEDARAGWVEDALPEVDDETVTAVVTKRYGEDAVVYDPANPESSKKAMDAGVTVVYGGNMSKGAWGAVRRAGALPSAGTSFPVGVRSSPDGVPPIEPEDWTPAMVRFADYVVAFARHCIGKKIRVQFYKDRALDFSAFYGTRRMGFNLARLGRRFVDDPDQQKVDRLVIHELGHEYVSDHMTEEFADACCRIGARLRTFEGTVT